MDWNGNPFDNLNIWNGLVEPPESKTQIQFSIWHTCGDFWRCCKLVNVWLKIISTFPLRVSKENEKKIERHSSQQKIAPSKLIWRENNVEKKYDANIYKNSYSLLLTHATHGLWMLFSLLLLCPWFTHGKQHNYQQNGIHRKRKKRTKKKQQTITTKNSNNGNMFELVWVSKCMYDERSCRCAPSVSSL